jgi:TetR/AcrR family transcriptional repressor of mexJK operon
MSTEATVITATSPENPKRAAIIGAARTLFLDAGYGATSMDDISTVAGVSKRTVYGHFANKESLFEGVMSGMCERLAGDCPLGDEWHGAPESVLTVAGNWFVRLITRPEAVALYRVVTAESARFPRLGETFYQMGPGRMIDRVALYLAAQHDAGTLIVPDAEDTATRFLEMAKGPLHSPLILGARATPSDTEISASIDETVRLFLMTCRDPA